MPIAVTVAAMALAIADFPHASDFATAYTALAMFTAIPFGLAFALRHTRLWRVPGGCVVVVGALGTFAINLPFAASDTSTPWLIICGLYAAFGGFLARRATFGSRIGSRSRRRRSYDNFRSRSRLRCAIAARSSASIGALSSHARAVRSNGGTKG